MNPKAGDQYFRNSVLTATPEQLQLMLYDGAVRFVAQAREAMQARDIEQTHNLLTKAQRIILEMQNSLRPEVAPEICSQMAGLYTFVYRRLIDANVNKDQVALDDAIQILNHMRQTWILLIEKLHQERAGLATPPGSAAVHSRMDPSQREVASAGAGGFSAEG
jgi:flagellar secretion chaperone FliS